MTTNAELPYPKLGYYNLIQSNSSTASGVEILCSDASPTYGSVEIKHITNPDGTVDTFEISSEEDNKLWKRKLGRMIAKHVFKRYHSTSGALRSLRLADQDETV
jgi:hypothetical protein